MRSTLRNVKLFVIHEVSMVSSLNLAYIHLRLEEFFGGNEWLGSKNMLFIGNILQLQPVNEALCFTISLKLLLCTNLGVWHP